MLLRHLELTALGSDVANCILLACEQLDPARLDKQKKKFQGKKKQFRPKCCVWTSVSFLPRKCEGWNYKMNRVLPDSSISRGLAFFVACCGVPCHVEV